MRFRKHLKEECGLKQFDIAPLIDVVFILLVFFMLTSHFIVRPGIKVDLPQAKTARGVTAKQAVITVSAEEIIYLNGEVIAMLELKNYLMNNAESLDSVYIKVDKNVRFGQSILIWDMCKQAGLSHVNIAAISESL